MRKATITQIGGKQARFIHFRVPIDLFNRFRASAARDAMTRQEAGRQALEAYCKRVERREAK